jgi:putative ABC transport system substrate-binding protein
MSPAPLVMLPRRRFLAGAAALGGLALGAPAIVRAQGSRPRIYMMLFRGWEDACDGFRDYLISRGLDVEMTIGNADREAGAVPGLVAAAKALRPDLVYIWGTNTAALALGPWDAPDPTPYLTDIPAVFNIVTEPVGNRIIPSLEHPGRNATGTLYVVPIDIQLRTIASYKPFKRLGIIYNPLERNSILTVDALKTELAKLGGELIESPVRIADGEPVVAGLSELVKRLKDDGADWLYIPPDTFLQQHRNLLTNSALQAGLPAFTSTEPYIRDSNALFGLVCRYYNIGQFTGRKAEQILREGAKPSELPVETLNRFSLLVNMRAANKLKLYPPMNMLRYAEAV